MGIEKPTYKAVVIIPDRKQYNNALFAGGAQWKAGQYEADVNLETLESLHRKKGMGVGLILNGKPLSDAYLRVLRAKDAEVRSRLQAKADAEDKAKQEADAAELKAEVDAMFAAEEASKKAAEADAALEEATKPAKVEKFGKK